MKKGQFVGNEGLIKFYSFKIIGKRIFIAISETKWHAGENYKKTPIWFSEVKEDVPAIFLGKLAIGIDFR